MANVNYFWTTGHISVVYNDKMTVVGHEDVRYPWVVRAALYDNQEMLVAALNHTELNHEGYWTLEYQNIEDEDPYKWDIDGVINFDLNQTCLCACEAFQEHKNLRKVRVMNQHGAPVYELERIFNYLQ